MSKSTGIVYILDGAGGSGWTPLVLRRALADLPYDVHHFRWGRGYMRIISDLTNSENIQLRSRELADLIRDYRRRSGNRKVYVIAKSAGTMVALRALAQVEEESVERAILLSPAVSPGFPLSDSLRAVKRDLVSFWSPNDLFWLGLGTSLFGTADGVPCRAAGLVGFRVPDEQELPREYVKLRQIRWEPSMVRLLHLGGHAGNSMPPFLRKHVVPLLKHDD
jgi:pimeloyl-ACP methyl ester carboxylesterase